MLFNYYNQNIIYYAFKNYLQVCKEKILNKEICCACQKMVKYTNMSKIKLNMSMYDIINI